MVEYDWNDEKDDWLRRVRNIGFQDVLYHISQGDLLDVIEHPNQKRYPGQRIFVLNIEDYVYIVPFVEDDDVVFLKTIIPSRKLTKRYLRGDSP